jgi:UPF0755 protein
MPDYSLYSRVRRWPRRILYTMLVVVLIVMGSVIFIRRMYDQNLKPVSESSEQKVFIVEIGSSPAEIGDGLEKAGLIRNSTAFEWYVKNTSLRNKLQAGTYKFSPSYGVIKIAHIIADGKVAVDLITLLPGQRIDQLRQAFIDAKFDPAAVDAALEPSQYADSPALADKPASATLEGFLYPDSYQKDATTDPKVIVRAALSEMETRLTPNVRAAFAARGLSVYQAVTLASVVEREVSNAGDRAQVAQVFFKRINSSMALESDATAIYGAVLAGEKKPSVRFESIYNTYSHKGLPPGPISNVTESSLNAVASPAQTDWTYFVAGDDGKTYFSKTLEEHESLTAQHCKKLCSL